MTADMTARSGLGLPPAVRACLFDLDGVLTRTASVHAAAWKQMFDAYLSSGLAPRGPNGPDGTAQRPFSMLDYETYVDGRPRLDGTRAFLQSRHIDLPEGSDDDPPGTASVRGLANRKNEIVLQRIRTDGVEVFQGSVDYVRAVREAGLATAVVSSSANTADVLRVSGIEALFDTRVDGGVARERHLAGKPAPDTFLAAAGDLGLGAGQAAVFEDALAGVEAGRAGGFALVVGVDRSDHGSDGDRQASALREHGADVVVQDLSELMEG
jgi:beta-phosphoglucomutase family hydrolase